MKLELTIFLNFNFSDTYRDKHSGKEVRSTEYMTLLGILYGTIDINHDNLEKCKMGVKLGTPLVFSFSYIFRDEY